MDGNFIIENGENGPRIVVTSAWSDDIRQYILSNEIRELELNYAKGWKDNDLKFLTTIHDLEVLLILSWTIDDISPIHSLNSLRWLQLSTKEKTEIDFSQFHFLEKCGLDWRPKAKSLFNCKTLKELFIYGYSSKDTSEFIKLSNLENLTIYHSPISSLEDLGLLKKLKEFSIAYFTKLSSLKGIEKLINLEDLQITQCRKITSIKEIGNLQNLKILNIGENGNIDTIEPIKNLKNLEHCSLYGSTNIVDGDMSPLKQLKNVKKIIFKDRKHYSHKNIEFPGGENYF